MGHSLDLANLKKKRCELSAKLFLADKVVALILGSNSSLLGNSIFSHSKY